ncbi:zinc-dependent alcohol dehydrogenase [Prauserella cavernicola]|uniref:Zinc-binding dehydrogenase n=1 Tax=Prauserella cavernicola TaxID=2800127 RepID=A0A934V649_9PSEU|nr:zinc-binding dehydrogenase [Prauserella cavernicola]MBK1787167.1 zinc-binding dehydrogenase [Prauserella cavernicola]
MTTDASTARAVLFERDADGEVAIVFGTVDVPSAGPGMLLIRPEFVGICGTDIEILHDRMPVTFDLNLPHSMGHEWSGTVVEVGDGVDAFAPGDRVLGHGDMGGNHWFGATDDGAAAELFVLPASMCFPVPDGVDMVTAAIIEPFACVLNGFQKIGGVTAADTVHVFGLGAIGLAAVAHAAYTGAQVVALDPSPLRRSRALALGAAAAFDPVDDRFSVAMIAQEVGRPDADIVVEASGASGAQAAALAHAAHQGRVLFMGLSRPRSAPAQLSLIVERDLTVCSSVGAPVAIWEPSIRYLARAGLDLGSLVTRTLPFSQAAEAFVLAQDSAADIKVMLRPDTPPPGVPVQQG